MLITGNRLLDALDILKERSKTLDGQFKASLFRFQDDDSGLDPREIAREYHAAQTKIARLQEAQSAYNLRVEVEVMGEKMTLQQVLHLIGAANRIKGFWVTAAAPDTGNAYSYMTTVRQRDKDNEYARRVVPIEEAQSLADEASRRALAFKQAIRSGNAREVEMDVSPELFE